MKAHKAKLGAQKDTEKEPKLAKHEWDFRKCPDEQVYLCWGYEFSREIPWIVAEFEIFIGELKDFYIKKNLNYRNIKTWWHPLKLDSSNPEIVTYVWLAPGFPDTPFLSLDLRYRTPPAKVARNFLDKFPESQAAFVAQTPGFLASPHCYPICIDWLQSNNMIAECFRRLLKNNRPESVKKTETRGKSAIDTFRADLKALGAYRLLSVMSVPQAMKHCGIPVLFADGPEWSKAKRRAVEILSTFRQTS